MMMIFMKSSLILCLFSVRIIIVQGLSALLFRAMILAFRMTLGIRLDLSGPQSTCYELLRTLFVR